MSPDNRATLKIDRSLFERLDADRGDRTWNEYLRDLHEKAPIERQTNELSGEQVHEIARASANEIEERLR